MNNLIRRVVCMIAFTACFALPVLADSTAFTDLGAGGSYDGAGYLPVSGVGIGAYQAWADMFTASVGGALSQIDLGLVHFPGLGTNSAVVSIYTDVSNNLGTLVFSSGLVSVQPWVGGNNTLTALSPSSGSLVAGGNYFLVVTPGAPDAYAGWFGNSTGAAGTVLFNNTGSTFFSIGSDNGLNAFDVKVNASSVPEPSTWLMLGAELFCLLAVASWKRSVSVR